MLMGIKVKRVAVSARSVPRSFFTHDLSSSGKILTEASKALSVDETRSGGAMGESALRFRATRTRPCPYSDGHQARVRTAFVALLANEHSVNSVRMMHCEDGQHCTAKLYAPPQPPQSGAYRNRRDSCPYMAHALRHRK